MLDNVRIDDNTINFELCLGSSTWQFHVGRDMIEFLAQNHPEEYLEDFDVDGVFEEQQGLLGRVAGELVRKGAPTDRSIEITVDDLP